MLRSSFSFPFLFVSVAFVACGSGGSSGATNGGSGSATAGASGSLAASGASSVAGAFAAGGVSASGSGGGVSEQPSKGGALTGVGGNAGAAAQMPMAGASATAGSSGGRAGSGGAPSGAGGVQSNGGATSGAAGSGGASSSAKCPDATWKQVWGDNFDGPSGTAVDNTLWTYDTGPNWYNGELQDYTSGTSNASLDGNGNLVIEARKEAREGREYTSARLKTEGKKTFTLGRIEGRMKLPYGPGMWPAFWMLGGNTWPDTGEIDIMENLGREPSIAHGTIHGPGYSAAAGPTALYTLPNNAKFSDDFHVFAIEWEAKAIRWYVDGNLYSTKTPADINGKTWVFDHGFFIILNLAVGGEWPGNPDATTVFPQKMVIDYIRVCQK
jgi:beta-glucanase (GH16 family)